MRKKETSSVQPSASPAPQGAFVFKCGLFPVIAIVLYGFLIAFTLMKHEPWRDEAQLWIYARDGSIGDLLEDLRFEAHPILWYVVLMPFAKAGLGFGWMQGIHFLVALAVAGLILFSAPLPRWLKISALFSYYLFWQYSVESRPYALGILLLFYLARHYPVRFVQPWRYGLAIALMVNTNVHMYPIGACLIAFYILESLLGGHRTRNVVGAIVVMCSGMLVSMYHVGMLGGLSSTTHELVPSWNEVGKSLVGAFFVGIGPHNMLIIPAIFFFMLMLLPLLGKPVPLLCVLGQIAGCMAIFYVKGGGVRHYGLIPITLLWGYWIATYYKDHAKSFQWIPFFPSYENRWAISCGILCMTFILSMPNGWLMHRLDRAYDYSGTKKMAEFLYQNKLDQLPIAAHRYIILSALSMHMPGKEFWHAGINEFGTYVIQDRRYLAGQQKSYEQAVRETNQQFPRPQPVLLVLDQPLDLSSSGFRLIHKVDDTVFGSDERCYLYMRN